MTPHNKAEKNQIAKIVIMPGDPKRALYIAKNYLTDYELVNDIRGMLAFTGYYQGKRITVMGSGMGIPSMGIYSYELFKFYDVELIIRVGSIGAYDDSLHLFDIILANESYSASTYAKMQSGKEENILFSNPAVNEKIRETAKEMNIKLHEGRVYSTDVFYYENFDAKKINQELNVLGAEMESFALFHNANICGKKAACLATVSDHVIRKEELPPEQREKAFRQMIELALNTILKIEV